MKRYVLYHGNCHDGFGAAMAAMSWAGPAGVFIPCLYGEPLPEIEGGAEVAILDFSFPPDVLQGLMLRAQHVIVLDHHKTAAEALTGRHYEYLKGGRAPRIRFDMEKSGAVLAWEYFHPAEGVPKLLQYIQDRDLWRFRLLKSREVNAALRAYPFDMHVWVALMGRVDSLVTEGEILVRAVDQQVKLMADNAVELVIGGHLVPCVNATVYFSEVGDELCKRFPERAFSAYYLDRADGKRQFGLRSRGGFDVSEVARTYGGGGHKAAAGFVVEAGRAPL